MNTFDKLRFEYGSLKKFAELVGVTTTTVYRWEKTNKIPVRSLKLVETKTNGKFLAKELRPDLFA